MNPASTRAARVTISPSRKLVTRINGFTVEPANQRQLLELLARSTETSVRHAPGLHFSQPASESRWHEGHDVRSMAQRRRLPSDARESHGNALSAAGARHRKVLSRNV